MGGCSRLSPAGRRASSIISGIRVYRCVTRRDEGRGGGTRKVKRKGHERESSLCAVTPVPVPRYVKKRKKRTRRRKREPVCEVEIYLRPCTSRASDSCLQSRPAGWMEKEERENASIEKQGKLRGKREEGGGGKEKGCETRKRMQKREKYPTHPLAPSPSPTRAHRSQRPLAPITVPVARTTSSTLVICIRPLFPP